MRYKTTLEDREVTHEKLIDALRQLAAMWMTKDLLEQSMIGRVVKRISTKHHNAEARKMAKDIVEKWREEVVSQHRRDQRQDRRSRILGLTQVSGSMGPVDGSSSKVQRRKDR